MACCLPTCAQGSSVSVTRFVGNGAFWSLWVLLGVLCIWGGAGSAASTPHIYRTRVSKVWPIAGHAPSSGGRWGHYVRDPRGVHWCAQKYAPSVQEIGSNSAVMMLYVLALVGPPSPPWL